MSEEVGETDGLPLAPLGEDAVEVAEEATGRQQPGQALVDVVHQLALHLARVHLGPSGVRVQRGQVPAEGGSSTAITGG